MLPHMVSPTSLLTGGQPHGDWVWRVVWFSGATLFSRVIIELTQDQAVECDAGEKLDTHDGTHQSSL